MAKLRELRNLLADESKWPDDFVWNYKSPLTCAMALGIRAGILSNDGHVVYHYSMLGISSEQEEDIFYRAHRHNKKIIMDFEDVQPKHVLEVIDRVLKEIEHA